MTTWNASIHIKLQLHKHWMRLKVLNKLMVRISHQECETQWVLNAGKWIWPHRRMEFVLSNQFRSNQIKCTYVEDLDRSQNIHTHISLFEFSRIYSAYICLFSHSFYYLCSHINPHFYYNMGQKVKRGKRKIINYLNSGRRITVSCCCSRVCSRWNINLSISTSFANILSPV